MSDNKRAPVAVRLGAAQYDEVIGLMNEVFTRKNGREMDFEKDLPNMCVRDDAHMRKHFGIYADGRLVAALGVYPLPTVIGGEELLFATVGNVVTHPDYEGRGYMSVLLDRAMKELSDLGVDVARLGGLRTRYNRYGFEMAGCAYTVTFSDKHRLGHFPSRGDGVSFLPVTASDTETIVFCRELYNRGAIAVTRTEATAYATMTAWRATPYVAYRDGVPIGYVAVHTDGTLAEQHAIDGERLIDVLCAWQRESAAALTFSLPPYEQELLRVFYRACASVSAASPSHFFVRKYDKLAGALLRVKARYTALPEGELTLGIEGYGTLRLFVTGDGCGCERTDRPATLTLDPLSATRYLFGPFAPHLVAEADAFAAAILPLPMGWCGQDRV